LPHGYDGDGPDHSSARLERFLQLVNDDPDHLPGATKSELQKIDRAFDLLDVNGNGVLSLEEVMGYFRDMDDFRDSEFQTPHDAWAQLKSLNTSTAGPGMLIDRRDWRKLMQRWYRRNAEKHANIVVVSATTPAQYFHVLRRQAHRRYRKPLVIMAPKYLLHHTRATSAFEDFGPGTYFRRVIADYNPHGPQAGLGDNTRHLAITKSGVPLTEKPKNIQRLIICCGQIYYHLSNLRRMRKIKDIAILRLEQIAPFPYDRITEVLAYYEHADVVWCQEEPKNMGAWFYVQPRLCTAIRQVAKAGGRAVEVKYIGRPVAAATATGSPHLHRQETKEVLNTALSLASS